MFHNGRKADANDVKYSLSRLASPDSRSPSSFLLLSDVVGFEAVNKQGEKELSGVRVVDPLTVEIRLQSPPKGDLATRMSHVSTAIIAKEAVEAGGPNWAESQPIGTGPWKLKEWVASLEGRLRRVPPVLRGEAEGRPAGDADRPGARDAARHVPER